MISDRFLDAGTYADAALGVLVRLTWDQRDGCWRLWKQRGAEWARVPGEALGADRSEAGIARVVQITWEAYEALVETAAAEQARG
jgi:hypothetical protein